MAKVVEWLAVGSGENWTIFFLFVVHKFGVVWDNWSYFVMWLAFSGCVYGVSVNKTQKNKLKWSKNKV